MTQDMNGQIADYRGLVESLASRLAPTGAAKRVGAEYDDLVQEGLINVWQTLERGVTPSADIVERRMRDWIKFLAGQLGVRACMTRPENPCPQHVPYETILPLDEFRHAEAGE